MHIHPSRPIADCISFDDIEGFDADHANHLATLGVIYLTEFKSAGRLYGGRIIARSLEQAEMIAFGRGLGEVVIGRLVEIGAL